MYRVMGLTAGQTLVPATVTSWPGSWPQGTDENHKMRLRQWGSEWTWWRFYAVYAYADFKWFIHFFCNFMQISCTELIAVWSIMTSRWVWDDSESLAGHSCFSNFKQWNVWILLWYTIFKQTICQCSECTCKLHGIIHRAYNNNWPYICIICTIW